MSSFDGSVSKLIESLSDSPLEISSAYTRTIERQEEADSLSDQAPVHESMERIVEMRTKIEGKSKLVCIGRSFWTKEAYNQIMLGNEATPIGINLINKRIELFKKVAWFGTSNFTYNEKVFENISCRSVEFYNKEKKICEVEEYFMKDFYDLFH